MVLKLGHHKTQNGYRKGKWYKRNDPDRHFYAYAFHPDAPALMLTISDEAFSEKPNNLEELMKVEYYSEHDSVPVLDRTFFKLGDERPSFNYFKRLGYFSSISSTSYYFLRPIIGLISNCVIDPLLLLYLFGAGGIKGRDAWEEPAIARDMYEIGRWIRMQRLLRKTMKESKWRDILVNSAGRHIRYHLRYVPWDVIIS